MSQTALLQSESWRRFQEQNGISVRETAFGLALVQQTPFFGPILYFPHGPVLKESETKNQESAGEIRKALFELAEELRAGWIRVEPRTEEDLARLKQAFGEGGVVPAPHDVQPRETLALDIEPPTETLIAQMKPKTRYNVRLAEKHGVSVRFSRSPEDIEAFINLIYSTTNRKAIRPHPKSYYRNFFSALSEEESVLAIAEHEGKILAANLLVFSGDTAHYLHGGSSDREREVMAPFLLHVRSIEEAKRRGMKHYDFGGVRIRSKKDEADRAWEGITRFKQGFAPKTETLLCPGTYDIVMAPLRYRLYRFTFVLRKILRGVV